MACWDYFDDQRFCRLGVFVRRVLVCLGYLLRPVYWKPGTAQESPGVETAQSYPRKAIPMSCSMYEPGNFGRGVAFDELRRSAAEYAYQYSWCKVQRRENPILRVAQMWLVIHLAIYNAGKRGVTK